ncbi:heavy-metal-associated domain-containing protein [Brevundimonas sp.]|uniref:heavy-metal-associated domain-containing protein n=1 Tax=Brevundimonas sp. TaxID=1871086 RepID=UPI002FC610DC
MQFSIARMSCGGCVKSITAAIASIDANAKVEADTATKLVTVETSASREDILSALDAAGYPAT